MPEQELAKAYDPKGVEDSIYARWEASGFFNPDKLEPVAGQESFTIVMPPPNVTGTLHMGHAVMLALEDLMIRFARMRGRRTLWLPGTDHAAIATQTVVEKKLISEGYSDPRQELGREAFLKKVEEFAAASHDRIVTQIKKMGASCDWSREAYTLDEPRSLAVRLVFKMMFDDGLIYRGQRIVNWCPRCQSTLADDEVEYVEQKTPFYYFKYGPVVIGTARPETKFLDKTIIVHPDDSRYRHLHNQEFEVDWIDGRVQARVIADPIIDPRFGTGAMTITPAHSFEDFDLAQKYHLPIIQIIDEQGNFTAAAGTSAGQNARANREKIVKILQAKGLVDKIDENYVHRLSVCYRCETPVEPLPKLQWFIDVKKTIRGQSLKDRMRRAVSSGAIKILPDHFTKIYFHWIDNLRDWCISRQIWFGHRIPVWYHEPKCIPKKGRESEVEKCQEMIVALEKPRCEFCEAEFIQDEDTLDTWFSSGLWTFSTLGWPEKTSDLKFYHPTSVLETGYDILFFWIARMIMMTTYALGEVPFRTIYLHGLVRDEQGRKMSKSIGNVIDPLDMTEKYGADATRLSLILGAAPGHDVKLSEAKIAGFRNFTNKLWNIARFIFSVTDDRSLSLDQPQPQTLADQWILGELDETAGKVTRALEQYEFSAAGERLRDFTWGSLADWYLEISKLQLAADEFHLTTQKILHHCLGRVLKLWHPFAPLVTEHLWGLMGEKKLLMIESWEGPSGLFDQTVREKFNKLQEIVSAIRGLRADYRLPSSVRLKARLGLGSDAAWLAREVQVIKHLARLEELIMTEKAEKPPGSVTVMAGSIEVSIELADFVDLEKERTRLAEALEGTGQYLAALEERLANKDYLDQAPPAVVEADRARLMMTQEKLTKLEIQYESLK